MDAYYYVGSDNGYLLNVKSKDGKVGIYGTKVKADAIEAAKNALLEWCKDESGGLSSGDKLVVYTLVPAVVLELTAKPEITVNDLRLVEIE